MLDHSETTTSIHMNQASLWRRTWSVSWSAAVEGIEGPVEVRWGRRRGEHAWDRREVVAVAWPPSFTPVTINGRLELGRVAQLEFLTLIRVQILHVPAHTQQQSEQNS